MLIHDLSQGSLLHSMCGNRAAVRAMHAETDRLTCAGDDGSVCCFDFAGGPARASGGGGKSAAAARREARLGPPQGAFAAGGSGGSIGPPSAKDKPLSQAEQYAEKKRLAEEAAREKKAQEAPGVVH